MCEDTASSNSRTHRQVAKPKKASPKERTLSLQLRLEERKRLRKKDAL